ncbi:nucleotidyltransferase substrate binding protein [Halalkalibacillus halophilus]|uniref:nucleotidyltransferase substrate binding protein n=1 Tax=Halalkalibacillus halophilus TaxID=392827 RepID=UPI000400F7A1|nr:nucleotidyltransferase substrate binding protein [Halalkalibacillus halophilus]
MSYVLKGRLKEQFDKFEQSYYLLKKYEGDALKSDLERAGFIHFFEMTVEHAFTVIEEIAEEEIGEKYNRREAVKYLHNRPFIQNVRTWLKMDNRRNLVYFLYTEKVSKEVVADIKESYIQELDYFHGELD